MTLAERPRLADGAVTAELPDGELVVSTPDSTQAAILNPMASVVLTLCDGHHSVADIVALICETVGEATPDAVRADVASIVDELARLGLLAS